MSESDSDEEPAIRYGTPLDPIEEDEIPSKRKYQQPADQYAVDAHGRRRFHGAFTGGFSAGYGNSVGTPEGWTPATFKSSRLEKAQLSSQRPEDFMDDEDRGEYGIAPRHMATQSEFTGQKRRRQQYHDGPIPGEPVLEQLLKAVHETAAVKMLRAMGWKPGQGTGDRLTKADKKKAKEQHKVYGCYMPPQMKGDSENTDNKSSEDSSDSEFEYETLFAPDDYEPYVLNRKDDRFGLGYSGLSRHAVLGNLVGEYGSDAGSSRSHLVMREKGKKVSIRGQAFGVGAFEADDEDIYASEDMSHYDFALGGPAHTDKKKPSKLGTPNVLKGFVKCSAPPAAAAAHAPPALPRDYAPRAAARTRFEPTTAKARDQGLGRHELTAEARGALLGEVPVPKLKETSTIATNVQTDKPNSAQPKEDLIAKLVGRNVNFVSTNDEQPKELDFISIKDTGKDVAKTFRPFMSDPTKQARYERYLADKQAFMLERDSARDAVAEWERNRELVEFEQAAKLYKPLTGVMGDRFTHASEPDEALNPLCAVAKSNTNYGLATSEQIEAAARGVYGVMTRSHAKWRPEPLVCKRFNIPDPEGGGRPESKSEDKPKVSYSIFSYLESSVHDKDSFTKEQATFSGSKSLASAPKPHAPQSSVQSNLQISSNNQVNSTDTLPSTSVESTGFTKRMTVAELFLKESEKDMRKEVSAVTETIDKFDKMDLYKSIFLSDSENEDEATSNKDNINSNDVSADDFIERPKNVERNLSPPRGIFANIDFDELNSWKRNVTDKGDSKNNQKDDNKEKAANETTENNANDIDVYGPRIPENLKKRLEVETAKETEDNFRPKYRSKTEKDAETIEIDSSSSSDSWVDVKEVKSKKVKKEKKKKKHKTKHKKSKHKKKER